MSCELHLVCCVICSCLCNGGVCACAYYSLSVSCVVRVAFGGVYEVRASSVNSS